MSAAAQQFATEEDFLAYALSRRLATSSSDPEASVVLWARSLAVLEDVRALPLLLDAIDHRMIGQRPRRRCRIPAFGEEPLTRAELRDLEEAGADLDIVRRAQTSLELFEDETPRKGRKQSAT